MGDGSIRGRRCVVYADSTEILLLVFAELLAFCVSFHRAQLLIALSLCLQDATLMTALAHLSAFAS